MKARRVGYTFPTKLPDYEMSEAEGKQAVAESEANARKEQWGGAEGEERLQALRVFNDFQDVENSARELVGVGIAIQFAVYAINPASAQILISDSKGYLAFIEKAPKEFHALLLRHVSATNYMKVFVANGMALTRKMSEMTTLKDQETKRKAGMTMYHFQVTKLTKLKGLATADFPQAFVDPILNPWRRQTEKDSLVTYVGRVYDYKFYKDSSYKPVLEAWGIDGNPITPPKHEKGDNTKARIEFWLACGKENYYVCMFLNDKPEPTGFQPGWNLLSKKLVVAVCLFERKFHQQSGGMQLASTSWSFILNKPIGSNMQAMFTKAQDYRLIEQAVAITSTAPLPNDAEDL